MNLRSLRRLVLIRPGALGDTLLLLPTLARARRQWPSVEITLAAREDVARLAIAAGLADHQSSYGSADWLPLFVDEQPDPSSSRELRRILTGSAVVAWLSDPDGLALRNLYHLGAEVAVLARGQPDQAAPEHMAMTLARGLEPLGLSVPSSLEEFSLSMPRLSVDKSGPAGTPDLGRALAFDYHRMVAFHVGSGGAAKRWPPPNFAALAERCAASGLVPVLLAGPQDEESVQAVIAASSGIPHSSVISDLPLVDLCILLGRIAAYVGNDSGVTHLASLSGARTLALFGPTDPALWAPLGQRVSVLRSSTGSMDGISAHVAWEALQALLSAEG